MSRWAEAAVASVPLLVSLTGVVVAATVAGLVQRRRVKRARLLPWLLGVLAPRELTSGWSLAAPPGLAWAVAEALQALLFLGLVLELRRSIFGHLPGTRRRVRVTLVVVAAATCAWTLMQAFGHGPALDLALGAACLAFGLAWLHLSVPWVQATFLIPVDPLHVPALFGGTLYLIVHPLLLERLVHAGPDPLRTAADAAVALLFAGWLCYAAWRREHPPDAPLHVIQHVWPWYDPP